MFTLILLFSLSSTPTLVDLNTASAQELQTLPGVGPSRARWLVEHRARTPLKSVGDLTLVKGFGVVTTSKLEGLVYVSGFDEPEDKRRYVAPLPRGPAPTLDPLSRFLLWKWSRILITGLLALACVTYIAGLIVLWRAL